MGSVTPASNPPAFSRPGEGLSAVEVDGHRHLLADILRESPHRVAGNAVVDRYGETTGVLLKLLDAGSRLPVHAHPTRAFAREFLASGFGKAECWIVLATRQVPGELPPRVWLGFSRDIERNELEGWIAGQDVEAILGSLHELEVHPGDAVFVRPGLPHAIGAGVFLAEVQEPTDFSVMAEYRGFPIAPDDAHLGRGWPLMIDVFDRNGLSQDELSALRPKPLPITGNDSVSVWYEEDVLGSQSHRYFRAYRLVTRGPTPWPHHGTFAVGIVVGGQGVAETRYGTLNLVDGDTFAVLADTSETTLHGALELIVATSSTG